MPIVTIETWPLKEEEKPALMKNITSVFTNMGIPPQAVTIVLHETALHNWGTAGVQHSITFKDLKK